MVSFKEYKVLVTTFVGNRKLEALNEVLFDLKGREKRVGQILGHCFYKIDT